MKRILYIFTFLLALFSLNVVSANAKNGVTDALRARLEAKIEAREQKLQQIQERITNRIQAKTASREAKLNQIRQEFVKKYYSQMSDRLWALVDRLEILATRIDARIAVIEAETDKDLTSAKADVLKAKTLLTDTKALLTSSDGMIDDIVSSQDPKSSFAVLRENISDVKSNLKEVHRLLVKVIGDIAGLRVGTTKVSPSPTPAAN